MALLPKAAPESCQEPELAPVGPKVGNVFLLARGPKEMICCYSYPNVVDPIVIELERPLSCDYLSGADPQCLSNPRREVA